MRGIVGVVTVGGSELAMGVNKSCGTCGHQASLHRPSRGEQIEAAAKTAQAKRRRRLEVEAESELLLAKLHLKRNQEAANRAEAGQAQNMLDDALQSGAIPTSSNAPEATAANGETAPQNEMLADVSDPEQLKALRAAVKNASNIFKASAARDELREFMRKENLQKRLREDSSTNLQQESPLRITGPPADFYNDPNGQQRTLRWWDGSNWTDFTKPSEF